MFPGRKRGEIEYVRVCCVCARAHACVRACVHVSVFVCAGEDGDAEVDHCLMIARGLTPRRLASAALLHGQARTDPRTSLGQGPSASSPMNSPDAVDGTADAQTGGMLGEYEHFWGGESPRSQFLVAFCSMYSRTLSVENFCQAWTLVLRQRHLRLCCLALWGLGVSSTCR